MPDRSWHGRYKPYNQCDVEGYEWDLDADMVEEEDVVNYMSWLIFSFKMLTSFNSIFDCVKHELGLDYISHQASRVVMFKK